MRVAVISASLGNFVALATPMLQALSTEGTVTFVPFTNENFPVRSCTYTPRMQARVPKLWGWDLVPGYDVYVWLDATLTFRQTSSVQWLLDELGEVDVALFKHPYRTTVAQEAAFLREELPKSRRLMQRYTGELLDEQLEAVTGVEEEGLHAGGVVVYRPTPRVCAMLAAWWKHVSCFHQDDQLSLPFVLKQHDVQAHIINANIYENPYLRYRPRGE
jgi:hypothetical protein